MLRAREAHCGWTRSCGRALPRMVAAAVAMTVVLWGARASVFGLTAPGVRRWSCWRWRRWSTGGLAYGAALQAIGAYGLRESRADAAPARLAPGRRIGHQSADPTDTGR